MIEGLVKGTVTLKESRRMKRINM